MKIVKWFSKLFSFFKNQNIQVILLTIISIFGILSWTVPMSELFGKMLSNYKLANGLICLCGVVLTSMLIFSVFRNVKKDKKYCFDFLYVSPLIFLEVTSLLIFFENTLWGYKTVFLFVVFSWLLMVVIIMAIATSFNKVFNREFMPIILSSLSVIMFVFSFTCASIGAKFFSEIFRKASVGIIYVVAAALYVNKHIYCPKKENKMISNIIRIILLGSIITITFPFYVQWCGLTGKNLELFASVYAAVLGGGITLAGVAWTIKDNNAIRQEDLKRIEEEHKEDERRQYRPIVNVFDGPYSGLKTDIHTFPWLQDTENLSKTPTSKLTVANKIRSCYFGNTDFANVYVWGIKINGHTTNFDSIRYIKKESYFFLDFSNNPIYTEKPIETMSLILEDMLGNLYELPLDISYNSVFAQYRIEGNNPSFLLEKV